MPPEDVKPNIILVDILFVLYTTASMGWCIAGSIETIRKIIDENISPDKDIKLALCTTRNHPP